MKKIIVLIFILFLGLSVLYGCTNKVIQSRNSGDVNQNVADTSPKTAAQTYKNFLTLEIPSNWYMKESGRNLYLSPTGIPSVSSLEVYLAFKPQPGMSGVLMSKEKFKELILKQTSLFSDVKVEELSDITIGGRPAIKMIISATVPVNSPNQKEISLKWMQIITTNGKDTQYDISYSSPKDNYNKYITEVEKILNSFNTK